jgi:uncharacterized SAM-binding protein YcdF (DUF218 family)
MFHQTILQKYAELFIVNNATKGADIILIIGGDNKSRAPFGIELYNKNYGKKVFFTTPAPLFIKYDFIQSENQVAEAIAKHFHITLQRIPSIKKNGATSTFDEAYDLLAYIKNSDKNISRVIIVTNDFHTARAKYAFEKVFKLNNYQNIVFQVASVPNLHYTVQNWWKTEAGLQNYIPESFKFLIYIFNSQNLNIIPNT